jgi:hypothetical protein
MIGVGACGVLWSGPNKVLSWARFQTLRRWQPQQRNARRREAAAGAAACPWEDRQLVSVSLTCPPIPLHG